MILTISVADHFIRATTPPSVEVTLNQRVQIAFVQEKLHFFDERTTENLARTRLDPVALFPDLQSRLQSLR